MIDRRQFIRICALGAIAPAAFGQQRPVKVGMLSAITKSFFAPIVIRGLGDLGYREGSTMTLEFRSAEGKPERFPQLARDLIKSNCDLVIAIGPAHAPRALRDANAKVPVVFLAIDYDPLEQGIVKSLVRPGGNMTGVTALHKEIAVKRLELAREVMPAARHFLVLADLYNREQVESISQAAESSQVRLTVAELGNPPQDYLAAMESGRRAKADAVILLTSPVLADKRADILAAASKVRLPLIGFGTPESMFPVGYSVRPESIARRAAEVASRILKGANPADIPVQQAEEFDLQVNLKAAKTLGMSIPYPVLARATMLIE